MLGFNWIDAIIIVLLALAVVKGIKIGFLTQLFMIAGFFGTLFVASWIFPHVLPFHNLTLRIIINGGLALLAATYAAILSFELGQHIHWSFRLGKLVDNHKLKVVETALGSLPCIVAGLILVWLLGVAIGRLPFEGFSNSVSDSLIVQQLTRTLPPVPTVFAELDKQVDPNSQPHVFAQPKPHTSFEYSTTDVQLAESKAAASVVRITSFGCGGIVSGSGFAISSDLVATNAHVIAGVKRPIIKYKDGSYVGVPVVFNPVLDVAILRVQALNAPPLTLNPSNVAVDTTVAVLGYPGGNYTTSPGIVRDTLAVSARSIYDQGAFGRGVYEVQTHIDHGSSGGPIVTKNGQTAGMIFSKSTDSTDYAYALTSVNLIDALHKAQSSHQRVNTGACIAD